MMDTTELTEYKKGLEEKLKTDELALERVKLNVLSQKRMIKLVEEQIEILSNGEKKEAISN